MSNIIKTITVITYQGVGMCEIGCGGVAEIKDESNVYENHTDFIFIAYDRNGNIVKKFINCPVDITYEKI